MSITFADGKCLMNIFKDIIKIQKDSTKLTSSNTMKFKGEKDKVFFKKNKTIIHVEKEYIIKKV